MFQRTAGTNYSTRQRIACFFMYLSTIMMCSALFYGVEQPFLGGISASFISSLLSTLPVFAVKFMLTSARPKVIKRKRKLKSEINHESKDSTNKSLDVSQYVDLLDIIKKEKQNTLTKDARKVIKKVIQSGNDQTRIELVDEFRKIIFEQIYDLPHCFKKIAIIFLVLYTIGCIYISIVYGISFDILYPIKFSEGIYPIRLTSKSNKFIVDNGFPNSCRNMNTGREIEEILSTNYIDDINTMSYDYTTKADSWGEIQDSQSWLASLFTSILLSIILWQPITSYIMTWAKLYAFTWNLSPNTKPGTLIKIFKFVCCGCCKKNKDTHEFPGKPEIEEAATTSNLGFQIEIHNIDDLELELKDTKSVDDNAVQWEDHKLFTLPTGHTTKSIDSMDTITSNGETQRSINTIRKYNTDKSNGNSNGNNKGKINDKKHDSIKIETKQSGLTNGNKGVGMMSKMIDKIKQNKGRKQRGGVVVRNERPMDTLSFFSHDILFVDKGLFYNDKKKNNNKSNNDNIELTKNDDNNGTNKNDNNINTFEN